MEDDWENIADEEEVPKTAPKIPTDVNKWAGEDEDDPKDSWEDALEEEKREEKVEVAPKPKKSTKQRIEEKEKARKELEEKRRKEIDDDVSLTPEEKLRLKQQEEEEYTRAALDTLGLVSSSSASIDSFKPDTKEDFTELSNAICKKLSDYKHKEEYVPFLDELVRNLLAGLSSTSMRKIRTSIDNLILEKQKLEKGDKPKKKTAAKQTKVKLRMEEDNDYTSRANYGVAGAYEDDDYEDFM